MSTVVGAEAEAEEALGPRGLNWPEAVEEGLGTIASKEAVSAAVLGSSLVAAAAELRSREAVVDQGSVANPECAGPKVAETLGLAAPREAAPALSAGTAASMGAEADSHCSFAAEAMEPGAAASALEAAPRLDASVACLAAPEPREAALGAGTMAALKAEPRTAGSVLGLVPVQKLEARTAASEVSKSSSEAEVEVAQEQADESPMGAVVETYFEEAPEGGPEPGARS